MSSVCSTRATRDPSGLSRTAVIRPLARPDAMSSGTGRTVPAIDTRNRLSFEPIHTSGTSGAQAGRLMCPRSLVVFSAFGVPMSRSCWPPTWSVPATISPLASASGLSAIDCRLNAPEPTGPGI